jgi:hypothetical protein
VLRFLVGALPPRRHLEALGRLLTVLESAHAEAGAAPEWLAGARHAVDASPEELLP